MIKTLNKMIKTQIIHPAISFFKHLDTMNFSETKYWDLLFVKTFRRQSKADQIDQQINKHHTNHRPNESIKSKTQNIIVSKYMRA